MTLKKLIPLVVLSLSMVLILQGVNSEVLAAKLSDSMTLLPLDRDFGDVAIGDTASLRLTLTNDSSESLTLTIVTLPLGVDWRIENDFCSGQALASGVSCNFDLLFSPGSQGTINENFEIVSEDPNQSRMNVSVRGTGALVSSGVPNIAVVDSTAPINDLKLRFGQVLIGSPSNQSVTIKNEGDDNLILGTISLSSLVASPFIIENNTCIDEILPEFILIPPTECTFDVRFTPTGLGGSSITLEIPSNDPDENLVILSVSGVGVSELVPDITLPFVVPSFGEITEGKSVDQTVTIKNDGGAPLEVGRMIGLDSEHFSLLNDLCSERSVLPAASCTFDIRFSPKGIGPFNDSLTIPWNDPDGVENPVDITVSGTGLSSITNNRPSSPELVFPVKGQAVSGPSVTFGFNKSQDPDGDPIRYTIKVCRDRNMEFGPCSSHPVATAGTNKGVDYASLNLAFALIAGLVLLGRSGSRKKIALMGGLMMVSGLLLVSCGSTDTDNIGAAGNPSADITQTVANLNLGRHHWQVTADDGKNGKTRSEPRSFVVQ